MTFDQVVREQLREVVREEIRGAFLEFSVGRSESSLLTYKQAGQLAGVHPNTVGGWIKAGRLPAIGSGRLRRVKRADVLLVLERLSRDPPSEVSADEWASKKLRGAR